MASMFFPWFGGGRRDDTQSQHLALVEKLQAFYQLANDALERAYTVDSQKGDPDKSIRVYKVALQAIQEGLQLPVQGSGLGGKADNVASWKASLTKWQQQILQRVRYLETGSLGKGEPHSNQGGSRPSPPPPVRPMPINLMGLGGGGAGGTSHQPGGVGRNVRSAQQQHQQHQLQRNLSAGGTRANSRVGERGSGGGSAKTSPTQAAAMTVGGTVPLSGKSGAVQQSGKEEEKYREQIMAEILDRAPSVKWGDIADLKLAKQALQEAVILPSLRPDLFSGPLRSPVRGILLYGPPGNGKTMLGKALASEAKACFFSISASSLTSKWVGEGEKLVRALFAVASEKAPSIIFIDEIDSILGARGGGNEHDAARRLKTEFLVQFDGIASAGCERVVVIGATNRPQDIDDAVRRRLVKRIYIPLPNIEGRAAIMSHLLKGQPYSLTQKEINAVLKATEGYSASDLTALCKEAAMGAIRELAPSALARVAVNSLRPVCLNDFAAALSVIKPSTNRDMLQGFADFTRDFGTMAS